MKLSLRKSKEEASFDLTPMIDVVMLLIVFFTLTSQFSRSEQAPLDLPSQRGDTTREKAASAVYLDMDRLGRLSTLGQPVDLPSLASQIAAQAGNKSGGGSPAAGDAKPSRHSPVEVVVRADRLCPSMHLSRVAEELSRAGVVRWRLATSNEGGPGAPAGDSK